MTAILKTPMIFIYVISIGSVATTLRLGRRLTWGFRVQSDMSLFEFIGESVNGVAAASLDCQMENRRDSVEHGAEDIEFWFYRFSAGFKEWRFTML